MHGWGHFADEQLHNYWLKKKNLGLLKTQTNSNSDQVLTKSFRFSFNL